MTSIQKQRRRGKSQPSLLKNIFTISFFYNENMLLYFVSHRVPYTADECPQFACTFPLPFPAIPQAIPGTFEAISQDIAQDHQGKEGEGQCQGYAGMFTQPVAQGSFPFFQSFHGVPLQPQVDDAREDVQAVDHVGRDAAVQAVGSCKSRSQMPPAALVSTSSAISSCSSWRSTSRTPLRTLGGVRVDSFSRGKRRSMRSFTVRTT